MKDRVRSSVHELLSFCHDSIIEHLEKILRRSYDVYTEESYGTHGLKSLQITECPDIVMEKVRVLVPVDRTTVHLSTTRILIAFLQPSHPSARKSLAEHSIHLGIGCLFT